MCLYTNKAAGGKTSRTKGEDPIKLPALKTFVSDLQSMLLVAKSLGDVSFPGYEKAWDKWLAQLSDIENEEDKLLFLKSFEIKTEQYGLSEIKNDLKRKLQDTFATTDYNAEMLLARLDHALREWTTSTRGDSKVYVEDVYQALSINSPSIPYNHDLIPSEPFF